MVYIDFNPCIIQYALSFRRCNCALVLLTAFEHFPETKKMDTSAVSLRKKTVLVLKARVTIVK